MKKSKVNPVRMMVQEWVWPKIQCYSTDEPGISHGIVRLDKLENSETERGICTETQSQCSPIVDDIDGVVDQLIRRIKARRLSRRIRSARIDAPICIQITRS